MTTAHLSLNNCAVMERTGDGCPAGRCFFFVHKGVCPRHGDVAEVQARYLATGELTDERRLPPRPRAKPIPKLPRTIWQRLRDLVK